MNLEVVGAGFGRTGTETLKNALEILGFGPCYHMFEIDKHPEHIEKWNDVRSKGSRQWMEIYRDYSSAVDWPTCAYFEELIEAFPESKVILTVRDPGEWFTSMSKTVFRALSEDEKGLSEKTIELRRMSRALISEGTFKGRLDDRTFCESIYLDHIKSVKSKVPPNRLLVYEVRHGWKPLCTFLDREVPSTEFPIGNSTQDFERRVLADGNETSEGSRAGA